MHFKMFGVIWLISARSRVSSGSQTRKGWAPLGHEGSSSFTTARAYVCLSVCLSVCLPVCFFHSSGYPARARARNELFNQIACPNENLAAKRIRVICHRGGPAASISLSPKYTEQPVPANLHDRWYRRRRRTSSDMRRSFKYSFEWARRRSFLPP
jgi:hypothetical protein